MKRIGLLILFFIYMFFSPTFIYADNSYIEEKESELNKISISGEAGEFIESNDITVSETDGIMNISPKIVFEYMWNNFKESLVRPFKMLVSILIIVILSSFAEGIGDISGKSGVSRVYSMICVIACVGATVYYIKDSLYEAGRTIEDGGTFMLSYVPVFSGVVAAGGGVSTATSYQLIVVFAAEVFVRISSEIIMPLLSLCLCVGAVEAINPTISLVGIVKAISKGIKIILGLSLTVFSGLLTVQSLVGTSADGVAIRAGKFVVSNLVPVVGNAVSDAYTTLKGSIGILKNATGAFGVIAIFLIVIPPIISVFSTNLCIYLGEIFADIFSVKPISTFLKTAYTAMTVCLSVMVCFAMMFIISTTVVMMVGMNIGA
ncbi:MAG: hypothetical protein ACI4KH_02235 [Oscillospiraceae bacterium]